MDQERIIDNDFGKKFSKLKKKNKALTISPSKETVKKLIHENQILIEGFECLPTDNPEEVILNHISERNAWKALKEVESIKNLLKYHKRKNPDFDKDFHKELVRPSYTKIPVPGYTLSKNDTNYPAYILMLKGFAKKLSNVGWSKRKTCRFLTEVTKVFNLSDVYCEINKTGKAPVTITPKPYSIKEELEKNRIGLSNKETSCQHLSENKDFCECPSFEGCSKLFSRIYKLTF